ncbi:MAG: hypothetical protein JWO02_815 [Solirubrobacterales bacterium]|nr:hypothetical protein [Solirubrobacterales bacterium]
MRLFHCAVCAQMVFFENSLCLNCLSGLGFETRRRELVTVQVDGELDSGRLRIVSDRDDAPPVYRCENTELTRCNWLVDASGELCASCLLTRTRPSDTDADGLLDFADAEGAKRRLLFTLFELGLPVVGFREREGGLSFRLLSSDSEAVTTGHAGGVITLDLDEADSAHRELMREQLHEPYRTLLGLFRHEIGHYYWPIVVKQSELIDRYRELFGDERESYADALDRHYATGPPQDWAARHVSAYASMHPWEDWAETWAHYLHITDSSQTARAHGLRTSLADPDETPDSSIRQTLRDWIPLTYAMNGMARSMGMGDLYPFVLAPAVIEKLVFVDEAVRAAVVAQR